MKYIYLFYKFVLWLNIFYLKHPKSTIVNKENSLFRTAL